MARLQEELNAARAEAERANERASRLDGAFELQAAGQLEISSQLP